MATEGPLLHDGSQLTAAADYSNTAGLAGQGGSAQFFAVAVSTVADRLALLASVQGQKIYGVLQNKPKLGDAADVGFFGPTKMQAGAAITRGADLMVNASGTFITWTAASGYTKVGIALESASGAGAIFTGFVYGPGGPQVIT